MFSLCAGTFDTPRTGGDNPSTAPAFEGAFEEVGTGRSGTRSPGADVMERQPAARNERHQTMTIDQGMRRMLRDFGRALSEAISDSSEATAKLRQIRDRGYSLYLLLDGAGAVREVEEEALAVRGGPRHRSQGEAPRTERSRPEPQFRINGDDLAFLRSVGIDPTRRRRSRRD